MPRRCSRLEDVNERSIHILRTRELFIILSDCSLTIRTEDINVTSVTRREGRAVVIFLPLFDALAGF